MKKKLPSIKEQGSASPRAKSIVKDAIALITEEGYGEFSLRKVAARNGIKLASLQYHFKNKEALLAAVLDHVLHDFGERFNEGDPEAYASIAPEQLLDFMVDFAVDENQRVEATNFFFQLWAMSCHDAAAAQIQEKIYAIYRKTISVLIQMVNPALSAAERNIRSIIIICILDGLMLFISQGMSQRRHVSKIRKQAKKDILRIVTDK